MAEGDPVRIIPHRGIDDDCGSLEVWFADGRVSVRFYWDNLVSRRLNSGTLTREQAVCEEPPLLHRHPFVARLKCKRRRACVLILRQPSDELLAFKARQQFNVAWRNRSVVSCYAHAQFLVGRQIL